MRMMLKFAVPTERGNAAFKDGSLGKNMESIISKLSFAVRVASEFASGFHRGAQERDR
jgi:hypothetical protein